MESKILNKALSLITWLVYATLFVFVLLFIFQGTDNASEISSIFEKVATINFTVAIGYVALIASIAAIASHNNSQDTKNKRGIYTFIQLDVLYILLNMMLLVMSFLLTPDSPAFLLVC